MVLLPIRRRRRTIWERDWVKNRSEFGAYTALLAELRRTDVDSAKNFLRMDDVAFQELLQLVNRELRSSRLECGEVSHQRNDWH